MTVYMKWLYIQEHFIIMIIMLISEDGQISIDFLLGISLFILSLGFLIQFIPTLFLSTSDEGSLNSVAYRTANILVEDPGWWENRTGNQNGTDWEIHTVDLSRIGLAVDKTPRTKQTRTPNILNKTKIEMVQNISKNNETILISKLGLYDLINGAQIDYGYNITFEQNNRIMDINGSALSFGSPMPASQDVFKITRKVLVETGKVAGFKSNELTRNQTNGNVTINITGPQNEDITVDIVDFNTTDPNSSFSGTNLNGAALNAPSDYRAYKKTNTSDFFNYSDPLNNTDTLRLVLKYTLFPNNYTYLELKFNQVNLPNNRTPYIKYSDRAEPLYEPASLVVRIWK